MSALEDERKEKFLALLQGGETGAGAARALNVDIDYFRRLRKGNRQFAQDWREALTCNTERRAALQYQRSVAAYHSPSSLPASPPGGKRDEPHRKLILTALSEGASLTKAAEEAGISYQVVRRWRKDDKEFEADVMDAIQQGIDRLEDEARRRAVDGYEEQVINSKGEVVQTYRRYSDNLLSLMLKSKIAYYRPDQTSININTDGGGTVNVTIQAVPAGEFASSPEESVVTIDATPEPVPSANDETE